jgi:hypothetical protein
MTETFQCGDPGALVAFLYDECEPGKRELIAAHITRCVSCANEISTLGATRRTLAAWRPPDVELGFQITRAQNIAPATVLTPKIAWWRQPLPAWAQAAAAVVIFAAGLSIGFSRNAGPSADRALTSTPSSPTAATVSRDDLAQLEQRLKTEMAQMRTVSTVSTAPASARSGDDALMQQVATLMRQGEEQQNRELTLRLVDLESKLEAQRREDIAFFGRSVGALQSTVRTGFGQQQQVNEVLIQRVSERPR